MSIVLLIIVMALAVNAVVAFLSAFILQARVILALFDSSDKEAMQLPWKALANENSLQNRAGRFFAGEIFPELRRKWLQSIRYFAISFTALFVVVVFLSIFAPQYLI